MCADICHTVHACCALHEQERLQTSGGALELHKELKINIRMIAISQRSYTVIFISFLFCVA